LDLSGSDRGEPGVSPIPYAAHVHRDPDSPFTWGIGILGVGGFRTNYPARQSNPILTPQPPLGVGAGGIASEAEILQIVPSVAYAVSDSFSLGFAPTVSMARINADPFFLGPPDDANGDGAFSYPVGRGSRHHWGGGFQVGAYHIRNDWHYGLSFKSPQWFEKFNFNTADELGLPRTTQLELEYPAIISVGTAYSGLEHLVLALDLRYLAYTDAAGLGDSGYRADGALAGLGWESIFALGTGIQARLTDNTYLRLGYAFNENPIPASQAAANIASPVILQHFLNVGASIQLNPSSMLSFAYTHGFQNSIEGPIQTPSGPLPGSRVRSDVSLDGLTVGMTIRH
jgi:long-chain fatty acid transport protein